MKALLVQLLGLSALVAAGFLFDMTVGIVCLAAAGLAVLVSGIVEELDGYRKAPPQPGKPGGPGDP